MNSFQQTASPPGSTVPGMTILGSTVTSIVLPPENNDSNTSVRSRGPKATVRLHFRGDFGSLEQRRHSSSQKEGTPSRRRERLERLLGFTV